MQIKIEVLADADAASRRAADLIARLARDRVGEAGRFVMAVSGGTEPWKAFRHLATLDVPWKDVHIAQVDERVAPAGSSERNLTHLKESLLDRVPIPPGNVLAMPVEDAGLGEAARSYERSLAKLAGERPVFDMVHLGIGIDGHTASLVPADPVLDVSDRDVAITGEYQGRRRMTLTYPALDRARFILWLVPGEKKAEAVAKLIAGDRTIPAGRVRQDRAIVLTDRAALPEAPPRR